MRKRIKKKQYVDPEKHLTEKQVPAIKKYLDKKAAQVRPSRAWRALTNRAIFDFMVNTGLRAEELINVRMRDLPYCHGKDVVNVRRGKGDVARMVVISPALAKRIKEYVKRCRKSAKPNSYLFVNEDGGQLSYRSLYSKLQRIGLASGVGRLTPHMLRHTYAMYWYAKADKDVLGLQDQLGHRDTETTHIYARTTATERAKWAAICDR